MHFTHRESTTCSAVPQFFYNLLAGPQHQRRAKSPFAFSKTLFLADIPDTHDLETFFHVKSERIKIEPELNNPEGIRGEPLGPENFQHHNFQLTTSDAIQNIPPLNQEEMMDVDEEMMPLAFRAINLN